MSASPASSTESLRGVHEHTSAQGHVFISYRHDDASVVDELIAALGERHPCWRDTTQIRGGQAWREAIVRAIDAAYALILVVSTETGRSKEVYAEFFYAQGRGVPIIPLWTCDCELPFDLGDTHARHWHRDREPNLRALEADLDAYRRQLPRLAAASERQTYLNALRLSYLLNVANYTTLSGELHRRARRVTATPQPVVMHSTFALRRQSPLLADHEVPEEVRDYDDLLPALHELRQVLVLGEPGIGKTTTLYKLADELRIAAEQDQDAPIPVILPLREWKDATPWQDFAHRQLGALGDRYAPLLHDQRLYLLLDGLNELPRDDRRAGKVETLRGLLREGLPAAVTCRELDYRDEALRLDLDTITIHPLAPERILDFLQRYLRAGRDEQAAAAEAWALFWQIAGGEEIRAVWAKW
jgi:hypothetical protein